MSRGELAREHENRREFTMKHGSPAQPTPRDDAHGVMATVIHAKAGIQMREKPSFVVIEHVGLQSSFRRPNQFASNSARECICLTPQQELREFI